MSDLPTGQVPVERRMHALVFPRLLPSGRLPSQVDRAVEQTIARANFPDQDFLGVDGEEGIERQLCVRGECPAQDIRPSTLEPNDKAHLRRRQSRQ